jgi:hypothetical protein
VNTGGGQARHGGTAARRTRGKPDGGGCWPRRTDHGHDRLQGQRPRTAERHAGALPVALLATAKRPTSDLYEESEAGPPLGAPLARVCMESRVAVAVCNATSWLPNDSEIAGEPDRRIFASLRGWPSSPYQAQISPFGAASGPSAAGGVVRHPAVSPFAIMGPDRPATGSGRGTCGLSWPGRADVTGTSDGGHGRESRFAAMLDL